MVLCSEWECISRIFRGSSQMDWAIGASRLMNAVHIALMSLLRDEQITSLNIETGAPRLLADTMEAAIVEAAARGGGGRIAPQS